MTRVGGSAPGATWTDADLAPDGPVAVEEWLGAPALSYPRRPASVVHVLDAAAARWPDAEAFVDRDGTTVTYARFARLVAGAAARLRSDVAPGGAVAVLARNGLELAVAQFACAASRTVLVGLNPRTAPAQWAWVLEQCGARLVLATEEFRAPLGELAAVEDARSSLLGAEADWVLPDDLDEAAAYAVVHTSGTTGRSKASQVVHRCSVHSAMSYQRVLQLRPGDRTAVLFPLHYISAMHAHVLPAMLAGATCVLAEPTSPRDYVELLHRERIAWAYAVPSWWQLCLRVPAFRDLPDLRLLAAGGSPFPATLVSALRERLPGVRLHDVYGLSETHSPATLLRDEELDAHAGTVGRPLPCMEVAVRDPDGRDLPAGSPGEVWLRGSLVTPGYAGDPEATARAIVDGWFDTGDVGRVDADGYLTVLDRTKDMINKGGTKVFSAEVEAVLRDLPGLDDVAVVGAPDPLAGEVVVAFVVGTVTPAQVRARVRDGLAEYAVPKAVHVVDALPRNATGKTDKPALRARLASPAG